MKLTWNVETVNKYYDGSFDIWSQWINPKGEEDIADSLSVSSEGISSKPEKNEPHIQTPAIPHKLIFLDTRYVHLHEMPKHFQENINRTASHYREAWKTDAPLWFLGNDECRRVINMTEPRLLPFFDKERKGQNLSNVCRISALYISGGYYFDSDMQSVKAVRLEPDVLFSSAHEAGRKGLFNSFIAAVPKHPVLEKALGVMLDFYYGKVKTGDHMGTSTLMQAFLATPEEKRGKVFMLNEMQLGEDPYYHDFPRHDGVGCCCDYVVEDMHHKRIHFYSRMLGAGTHCEFRHKAKITATMPKRVISQAQPRPGPSQISSVSGLSSVICGTQKLPDPVEHEKKMRETRALTATLPQRCEDGLCKMKCGDNDNFMVPLPPTGTLLSIHQATSIWCALDLESKRLGRPANLLVWGLGNDSPFWVKSTEGRVTFIENNAKWFSKIKNSHPGLDQYLVTYHTSIQRDLARLESGEFEQESSNMLGPLGLSNVTWDVILVDAPNGCSQSDTGRFIPIHTSKQLAIKQGCGCVFVDDYQRTPERKFSDFVLDSSSTYCPISQNCGKRVAVWDRIHPESGKFIEELAMFSFGSSTTDEMIAAMLKVEGANP
eukprot:scaffold4740_cov165-Amphora_coffeaeformis.AAC.7